MEVIRQELDAILFHGKGYFGGLVNSTHAAFSSLDDYGPGMAVVRPARGCKPKLVCVLQQEDIGAWRRQLESGLMYQETYRYYEYLKTVAKPNHDLLFTL